MPAVFSDSLLEWYDREAVDMPWRESPSIAYHVWLSEIMLQQTQVETVRPYYKRFLEKYPSIVDLARAPLDDVLKLWEGLGYYSRARNLHKTARIVSEEHNGQFPDTVEGLMKLPGIGRYTAGAIASIAFGVRAPVVDGNVIRVFSRLLDLNEDVTQNSTQAMLWSQAEAWLPDARTGDYNQALMELGRTVCKPRNPECEACPINAFCLAFAHGTQSERPVKKKKAPTPHYDVTAGLIRDKDGNLLIAQRPPEGLLGGLWEFPGGKQENGESLEDCLKRELKEELGIDVEVDALFTVVKHGFTHFKITLHTFECRHVRGEPQALQVHNWAWVREDELGNYSFGKADREVIAALSERGSMLF